MEAYDIWYINEPKFTHVRLSEDKQAYFLPIRKIERIPFSGLVYNIETTDHTYLVNNVVISNCWGKVKAIKERVGLALTHDEVTYMCLYIFHSVDAADFYRHMDSMSDEELEKACKEAQLMG